MSEFTKGVWFAVLIAAFGKTAYELGRWDQRKELSKELKDLAAQVRKVRDRIEAEGES